MRRQTQVLLGTSQKNTPRVATGGADAEVTLKVVARLGAVLILPRANTSPIQAISASGLGKSTTRGLNS
jgi:hypothetical protein